MGVALAVKAIRDRQSVSRIVEKVKQNSESLRNARPTAVNLSWGVEKALTFLGQDVPKDAGSATAFRELKTFVKKLADQDVEANKKLSVFGQVLIRDKASVLTHCN